MTTPTPDLNALLGSRICHDLISPLGAIGNGVELLQMTGLTDSAELSLITESVENANARIRLFRVAFGAASPDDMMPRSEITTILGAIAVGKRIEFDWQVNGDVSRDVGRLVFLLFLCCETAMPRGGQMKITRSHTGDWTVHVISDRLRIEPQIWAQLSEDALAALTAAEVHFPLANMAATQLGRQISVDTTPASLTLRF